jgi:hypothetical protein
MVTAAIVSILPFLCTFAAADVMPMPPGVPVTPPAGPTELDKGYYYSTIGQELAYAKLASDAAARTSAKIVDPKGQSHQAAGAKLQAASPTCAMSCPQCPAYPQYTAGLGNCRSATIGCGLSPASRPEVPKCGACNAPMQIAQWTRLCAAICPLLFTLSL